MVKIGWIVLVIIVALALGLLIGAKIVAGFYKKHCDYIASNSEKFVELYSIVFQWLRVHLNGKTLASYCNVNNYSTVAIYGLSEVGYELLHELENNGINVRYCIDRNADNIFARVNVLRPDADLPDVDAVIVVVVQYYEEIKELLGKKLACPIVSLADVVWEA